MSKCGYCRGETLGPCKCVDEPKANASMFTFIFKALEVTKGDVLIIESSNPIPSYAFDMLRKQFQIAKQRGAVPDDLFILVLDREMNVKKMDEREARFLLDQLCAAMKMRAVPL